MAFLVCLFAPPLSLAQVPSGFSETTGDGTPHPSSQPLDSSAAPVTKSAFSLDEIDLDDPDMPKALEAHPSLAPCPSRLPHGGVPGVFPQAADAMGGRCAAMAFAVKSYAPVSKAHRELLCEDPAGAKKSESDLARQALAALNSPGGHSLESMETILAPLRHEAREKDICARWGSVSNALSPSVSIFSIGVATISGRRCPAALMEVRITSGRYAPAKNYFLAGIAECEGTYVLPSQPFSLAFVSLETADPIFRRLLSTTNWRGPTPSGAENSYSRAADGLDSKFSVP